MPTTVSPSLADALAEQRAAAQDEIPDDTLTTLQAATDELTARGRADDAVQEGDSAPDFALPNVMGDAVRLSERLQDGPVVLSFYRGGWCPYCNLELRALQEARSDIDEAGGSLIAVSPQTPDASLSAKEKAEIEYEMLSDVGNEVADDYGLVFALNDAVLDAYDGFGIDLEAANGDDSGTLPMPATYVIDTDGTVRYAFVNADYTRRADPAEVVETLRAL